MSIELAPIVDVDLATDDTDASAQAMADQFDMLCACAGFARDLIRAAWNATAHGVQIEDWPAEIEKMAYHWSLLNAREPNARELAAGIFEPDDAISEFVPAFSLVIDELDASEAGLLAENDA